jgi:hypothetical protein
LRLFGTLFMTPLKAGVECRRIHLGCDQCRSSTLFIASVLFLAFEWLTPKLLERRVQSPPETIIAMRCLSISREFSLPHSHSGPTPLKTGQFPVYFRVDIRTT